MSANIVDQITLECLMNKELYSKLTANKKQNQDNKAARKVYKKRLIELTKNLLSNEKPDNLMPDVEYAFDNYVKTCIRYFKIIDESDVIQQNYEGLEPTLEPVLESPLAEESSVPKTSKFIKFTSGTLDEFVNYRDYELSVKEVRALPKQKEEKEEMVLLEVEEDDGDGDQYI
jgi:hypothetical protein